MKKIGGNISPEREAAIKKTLEAFENAPTEPTEQCADGADHDFKGVMHTDSGRILGVHASSIGRMVTNEPKTLYQHGYKH